MRKIFEVFGEGGGITILKTEEGSQPTFVISTQEDYGDGNISSTYSYATWDDAWTYFQNRYQSWYRLHPSFIERQYVAKIRASYEIVIKADTNSNEFAKEDWLTALDYSRTILVETALSWEKRYGVMPAITSAVSEYDAARMIGISGKEIERIFQTQTAVTRGYDFIWNDVKYQIKANRPSGKKGSIVTMISKPRNYDWDNLIWLLYDKEFNVMEGLLFSQQNFKSEFDTLNIVRPVHLRNSPSANNLLN